MTVRVTVDSSILLLCRDVVSYTTQTHKQGKTLRKYLESLHLVNRPGCGCRSHRDSHGTYTVLPVFKMQLFLDLGRQKINNKQSCAETVVYLIY